MTGISSAIVGLIPVLWQGFQSKIYFYVKGMHFTKLITFSFFRIGQRRMQIVVQKGSGTLEMAQGPLHVITSVVELIWMLQRVTLRLGIFDIGTLSMAGQTQSWKKNL